jgi:parvulin-like peptidyl-prolyl isomerase
MNRTGIISLLFLTIFVSNISFAGDRVVAKFNGQDVLKSEVVARVKEASGGKLPEGKSDLDDYSPEVRQQIIGGFMQEKLLSKAADDAKIDSDPAYKAQLQNFVNELRIRTYLEKYAKQRITPVMIRDAYNGYVKELKSHDELKVSHVLLKTEAEANKLAAEINANKITFEEAAKKHSIDQMSKDKGGDIGFISVGQTVPEFEKIAYSTKKGAVSAPVKTNHGWHIIKVLDSRKRKIPSFSEIEKSMAQQIKMGLMQRHVGELMQQANVEILAGK